MAPRPSLRVKEPVSRFSSTVRWPKQCRPSITWMQPRRTRSLGVSPSTRSPLNSIDALGDVAALGLDEVGDRLQRRRLAGAVGAQQRDDATLPHFQRHALEHQNDVVVDDLDVLDRKDRLCRFGVAAGWAGDTMPTPVGTASSISSREAAACRLPASQVIGSRGALALLGAVARRDVLLLRVLGGRLLDHAARGCAESAV